MLTPLLLYAFQLALFIKPTTWKGCTTFSQETEMAKVTEPEVYMDRVGDVLGDEFVNGKLNISLDISSVDEANLQKEKIGQQQKQLRQIKEEINQDMEYIHVGYKEASVNVNATDPSFFAGLFGRRDKDISQQRQALIHGQEIELEPFNDVKLTIDDLLKQLDGAKLELTNYINENK